jgi:DNA-binding transcriptional LysR family regulator
MDDDLNDLYYFVSVVQHGGFSAAAHATGVEKTKLSRRVAQLERRLGVRLLQRSTRRVAITDAGRRFFDRSLPAVEEARAAYESMAALQKEPAGLVRVSVPVVLAQIYLAPILPGFMALYPKVRVVVEATDRVVNLLDERIDLALRARPDIGDSAGLVARKLGSSRRVLVASPGYLARRGRPASPADLTHLDTLNMSPVLYDEPARWELHHAEHGTTTVTHLPVLASNDMRFQVEAATHGIGIALLPEPVVAAAVHGGLLEVVLPEWSAAEHIVHLVYPLPRGMLPSVRSLIDYLVIRLPASIEGHLR